MGGPSGQMPPNNRLYSSGGSGMAGPQSNYGGSENMNYQNYPPGPGADVSRPKMMMGGPGGAQQQYMEGESGPQQQLIQAQLNNMRTNFAQDGMPPIS